MRQKRRNPEYEDELIEFKPRYKGAIYGVRNGSYRAYVWDLGHTPESWEGYRYKVGLIQGSDDLGYKGGSNKLPEAIGIARSTVSGRAFRAFIGRIR